jgi:hypothetical protein
MTRLNNDLTLLTTKLAEIRGAPVVTPQAPTKQAVSVVSSSFVSGIRKATEMGGAYGGGGDAGDRLQLMERVLERISEFDREVLKKTAPPTGEVERRASVRADLMTLPTHLHVTDRLLDLFAQAQRTTVVRQTTTTTTVVAEGAKSPPGKKDAANDQALAESQRQVTRLEGKVASLMKQISDSEEKNLAAQTAAKNSKIEVADLQKTLSQALATVEALRKEAAAATTAAQAAASAAYASPVKSNSMALEDRNRQLEERLEVEVGTNQRMVAAVLGAAESFAEDGVVADAGAAALSDEGRRALEALASASRKVADQRTTSFTTIQREWEDAQARLERMQKEHGYLLAAHEETKMEVTSLRAQLQKAQSQQAEASTTAAKAQADVDQLVALRADLAKARALLADTQQAAAMLQEAAAKLARKDQEIDNLRFDMSQLAEELESYKKLAETLKAKMRDMGGKDTSFFDSFEEVMKDEMMAMKWAFEAKLRVAKEKADAMSLKHQQEINKLREASSGFHYSGKGIAHSGSTTSLPR